jgi:hypothetical protein
MDYVGLYRKFPVNRDLTRDERALQLKQGIRLPVEPAYQLSVIRSNSTYMELVDKFYPWKGIGTTFLCAIMAACLWVIGFVALDAIQTHGQSDGQPLWFFLFTTGLFGTLIAAGIWLLRKESFAYTHYPIRLNRSTRMVHVFRLDGTVLSVKWNDVFFCLTHAGQGFWNIVGHVLDKDGKTVKETFPLPVFNGGSEIAKDQLRQYWEFVRRYMEEGPKDAAQRVEFVIPIATRRETLAEGFHRMHAEGGSNIIMSVVFAALATVAAPGRWFAMRTSKIPRWPEDIEASCQPPLNDPFAIGMGLATVV